MLRRVTPMVYGIVVVIAWLTIKGTAATVISVVGAMLVGLMYVVTSPKPGDDAR